MYGLHLKSVKVLIISLIALIVIAAVAIPALAESPGGGQRPPAGPPSDQNSSCVQGVAAGTITLTPDTGTAVTLTMPADKVEAIYTVSGANNILKSLMIIMPKPTSAPITTPGGAPPAKNLISIQGLATGSITVTPSSGAAVTLTMPSDKVKIDYKVVDNINILQGLMVLPPQPSCTPTSTPATKGNNIQGIVSGTITLTPDSGTAVTLTMPAGKVEAIYTVSGENNILKSLMIIMPKPSTIPTGAPAAPNNTRIQGTLTGAITITPDSGSAVTLSMPSDKAEVVYSVSDATSTLISINAGAGKDGPGGPRGGPAAK
jgi:hypothetical protein